jgi:hypothetical protein
MSARKSSGAKTRAAAPKHGPQRSSRSWLAFAALALTAIAYWNSLSNDFLVNWDDDTYVIDNAYIKDPSLAGIRKLFTAFYSSNYHPLTALSNLVEHRIFGLDPSPFHAVNATGEPAARCVRRLDARRGARNGGGASPLRAALPVRQTIASV